MQIQELENTFLDGDWTEKFISAVQARPAIYNSRLPEHSDRNLVSRLWEEVLAEVSPGLENVSPSEKYIKVKELQTKWKNLRTCFRREIAKQKKTSSGQAATKRRKYIYFDVLSFLLPTIEDRPTISDCGPGQEETGQSADELARSNEFEDFCTPSNATSFNSKRTTKRKSSSYEEALLKILKEKKDESNKIDEDKSFLLSLLPSLRKLSDVQKIDLKMEFLATVKRHLRCSDSVMSQRSNAESHRQSYSRRSQSHHSRYAPASPLEFDSPPPRRQSRFDIDTFSSSDD